MIKKAARRKHPADKANVMPHHDELDKLEMSHEQALAALETTKPKTKESK